MTTGRNGKDYVTKDSGERQDYASGMRRDTQEGKPNYALIDRAMLNRWAELMTRGAGKYGKNNWQKADSEEEMERFKESANRHFEQWFQGLNPEEDHAAAIFFNVSAYEFVKAKIAAARGIAHEFSDKPVDL